MPPLPPPPTVLDVENDDERVQRLGRLLQRTDSTASQIPRTAVPPGSSAFDFGVRETHAVDPPTQLLARLQDFLPQMEAANADLLSRAQLDPESVDIEHLDRSGASHYIEMNLGLGVYDLRPASESTSSVDSLDHDQSDSASGSSDESSSDSDSSSSASDGDDASVSGDDSGSLIREFVLTSTSASQRPTRPLPKRARPNIVVLGETSTPPNASAGQTSS